MACEIERVKTREEFGAVLETSCHRPHSLRFFAADFRRPGRRWKLAREKRPDIPFIFVSGTIGEEVAINALQCGASDYVFKHRLPRLGPAVQRAVADAAHRRELQRAEQAMIQSEYKYRQIFECLSEAALLAEVYTGRIVDTNRQAELLLDRTRSEILGSNIDRVLLPETLAEYRRKLIPSGYFPDRVVFEGEIFSKESKSISVAISAAPIALYDRHFILGLYRDITERRRMAAEMQQLKEQLGYV